MTAIRQDGHGRHEKEDAADQNYHPLPGGQDKYYQGKAFLPSQVSSYLNTFRAANSKLPASESRCANDTVDVPPAATKSVSSPDQDVLTALLEIPGLTHDEMLRAYGVLASDDRRMYQSLVALPMDTTKDYCCMLVDIGTNKQAKLQ